MGLTFGTDLSGKVAVVTGAGGVLCGMFARTLSEAGAAVALLDINEEAAAKAADEITRLGGRAVAYRADVMDKEELESVHARVLAQFGYGLYDRALGATYLNGLFEAVEKMSK